MIPAEFTQEVLARKSDTFVAPAGSSSVDLLHAAVGLATESGEFLDAFKKCMFYGAKADVVNLREELGDMLWYITLAANALGVTIEELMDINTRKLERRYGKTYVCARALERNLTEERKALESTP